MTGPTARLRELALAATPNLRVEEGVVELIASGADAAYINAANPAAILALLDDLARTKAALADINDALRIAQADDIEGMERERIEDIVRDRDHYRAALAEAQRDGERLDWLESVKNVSFQPCNKHVPLHAARVHMFTEPTQHIREGTVRAAIDVGMQMSSCEGKAPCQLEDCRWPDCGP